MHPVSGNLPTSSWSQQTHSNALCCVESQNALYICSKPSKHRHSCGHPQVRPQGLSNPNTGSHGRTPSPFQSYGLEGSVHHSRNLTVYQLLMDLRETKARSGEGGVGV